MSQFRPKAERLFHTPERTLAASGVEARRAETLNERLGRARDESPVRVSARRPASRILSRLATITPTAPGRSTHHLAGGWLHHHAERRRRSFDCDQRQRTPCRAHPRHALFDVAYDPGRPFVVHTPEGDITVLGTSFVVRISEVEVRTTVIRGSVAAAAQRTGLFSRGSPSVSVTAAVNQEILMSGGVAELLPITAEAIRRRLAWRVNMLAFDDEPLNEVT